MEFSLQVYLLCKLNNCSDLCKITMYFLHLFIWNHRLWIEFSNCVLQIDYKHIKTMIPLFLGASGLGSLASGSTCFLLFTHHCLCAIVRQRYRNTGRGEVGHQMGLKSSQMGGVACVAWIRLLGIPRNVEGRYEIGFKEGCLLHPRIFYFLL